ncbi:CPBP family intramembrane glutamic endopeptidase [Corynebacterium riegelii]|uniref:CPBP family intramembrane glutamic endopeptidase n=1 Tax=Corynebacterium riegelii TaxID=156976 RepID=UPI00288BBB55|nr:CPBP family intramembrane glutamic endopeptidase [Corynebacterium riegelii]
MRERVKVEILIVLAVTFGTAGLRAGLRLIDALFNAPLNQQTTVLVDAQSSVTWMDLALQLTSALVLVSWGALAWYLLWVDDPARFRWRWPRWRDWGWGAGLAALIGLPGLAFYVTAVHLGLSKVVVPATDAVQIPTSLLWAFANGFGEEIVVVLYLMTRLGQLGWKPWQVIAASSVLRGSYHLYQGISAGVGNIVMGVVFCAWFARTGRVWPLVIAHFLIDATAFTLYPILDLSWLGI